MTDITAGADAPSAPKGVNKLYFAAWRWHFYAGLFVLPFMLILAVTGLAMMLNTTLSNQLGYAPRVEVAGQMLSPSAIARAAQGAVPGDVAQFITPEAPDRVAYVVIRDASKAEPGVPAWKLPAMQVAVNPYTGEVLAVWDKTATIYAWANDIHGSLLIGDTGDRIMEIAASLTLLLIATGIYMWWPRGTALGRALVPDLSKKGRALYKELHVTGGIWVSAFLVLFILSGLAWTGIWGDKFVQPWSSYPPEKDAKFWSSDLTHRDMNFGPLDEIPWGLEKTPMPESGTAEGEPGLPATSSLDAAVMWAQANGFAGQYKVQLPAGEKGVYTVLRTSQGEDTIDPTQDRTVHFDRYTGKLLADVGYDDYSLMAKAMAWGIALHKGLAGTWNFVVNLVLLAIIVMSSITGIVMWWKRRPSGAARLAAPPMPSDVPLWKGAVLVALVIAMAFPMAGLALIAVIALDVIVLANVPVLKRALS
ncbi:MAG: PepSY-associated TM helix domain-containing protein [Tabrizicola sp.]